MTLIKNVDAREVIDEYVKYRKDYGGWVLVDRSLEGAQFRFPKSYNPILFWLGLLTCWIYGLGILIWLLGILVYFLESNEPFYVDIRRMKDELQARAK